MLITLIQFALACSVLILPIGIAWVVLAVSDKAAKKNEADEAQ